MNKYLVDVLCVWQNNLVGDVDFTSMNFMRRHSITSDVHGMIPRSIHMVLHVRGEWSGEDGTRIHRILLMLIPSSPHTIIGRLSLPPSSFVHAGWMEYKVNKLFNIIMIYLGKA